MSFVVMAENVTEVGVITLDEASNRAVGTRDMILGEKFFFQACIIASCLDFCCCFAYNCFFFSTIGNW